MRQAPLEDGMQIRTGLALESVLADVNLISSPESKVIARQVLLT